MFCSMLQEDTINSPAKFFDRIREKLRKKRCREEGFEFYKVYTMFCCEDYFNVLSLIMLSSTLGCLITIARVDNLLNTQPMAAVNFIFSLVACCLSTYQILITMLLLWQARQEKGNIFICSLWYVSHISLLSLYFLLFSAKLVVCCCKQHHFTAVFTAIIGVIYEGAFIYFAVVVNSYIHSLHQERYL